MSARTSRAHAPRAAVAAALLLIVVAAPVGAAQHKPAPAHPAVAVDSSRALWTEARTLADSGRYEQALGTIHRGLARVPDQTDLRWLEAGVTGQSGRHAEAVALYEKLVQDHPELARDVRSDLANERLAAGDAAGAVRDFELRMSEDPSDRDAPMKHAIALARANRLSEAETALDSLLVGSPGDPDLLIERAQVRAWRGHNGPAADDYRAVLAQRPENRRARLGLAQNENWMGLHRKALADLAPLAAEPDADPEVFKTQAFAYYWAGEPAQARAALDRYHAVAPGDQETRDLERHLGEERGYSLAGTQSRVDDSDGLRVESTGLAMTAPLPGQAQGSAGWRRDVAKDAGGKRTPVTVSLGAEKAWSAAFVTRATLGYCSRGGGSSATGLGELAITARPDDRTRIDAGVSRDLVLTRTALALDIVSRSWVVGADWTATERVLLHAHVRLRDFTDDNHQQNDLASARFRAHSDHLWQLDLRVSAERLRSHEDLDHGYYDPLSYTEWGPGLAVQWMPRPDVTVYGDGLWGWQHEQGSPTESFYTLSGRVAWSIAHSVTVTLEGGRSDSNLQSTSGYQQKHWALSVSKGF